jgi:hypothetical protein
LFCLGLFDRVGIDLVFGLPLTLEGFKGILLITDYLSKYPFVFCIKFKQAIEIATRFLEFISYFGQPNVPLSDFGTEFLYKLVHNVSAYHPQTNGLTEKFNDYSSTLYTNTQLYIQTIGINGYLKCC